MGVSCNFTLIPKWELFFFVALLSWYYVIEQVHFRLAQEKKKNVQFWYVWFIIWECWMLETINVKLSNILRDKMLTHPLSFIYFFFLECCFFSGYAYTLDAHLFFLFLFLFIQLLILNKLLRGTFLFPLQTLLSFYLLFCRISSSLYAKITSRTSQRLSKLYH